MIKLSDYVIEFLVKKGIKDIFLVSGGGIMHLLDSVGNNKDMNYFCNHHEQASAICAEGYARIKKRIAACLVTTGPGSTNALSGAVGAWYDSIPLIVISGQVKGELIADYSKVRQLGPQEVDIVKMAKPMTKYAKTILDPNSIRYELEYAFFKSTDGRPGPVWIDIPIDVQGEYIDDSKLQGYVANSIPSEYKLQLKKDVNHVVELIKKSKRPIIIGGNGVRLGNAVTLLNKFLKKVKIPIVLPYSAKDLIEEDNPLLIGVFGTAGQRKANFAVQNSDCVLSIASGLNSAKVGFNYEGFAPKAKKIIIDVDKGQLTEQVVKPDYAIQAAIEDFLQMFLEQTKNLSFRHSKKWLNACQNWEKRYPVIIDEFYADRDYVNSYVFMDRMSDVLTNKDIVVVGNGLDCISFYQAFRIKKSQRGLLSGNHGSMGWGLPASIGACIANNCQRTICITGDGSVQMNIQELQTIKYYSLPIKIFVFNNSGYAGIRATQNNFFNGRFVGADASSGVSNPDFEKLAGANGIAYCYITNNDELMNKINSVLTVEGPVLCELNISPSQGIIPKSSAYRRDDGSIESRPLEDMAPFLPREEIWKNMHLFDEDQA